MIVEALVPTLVLSGMFTLISMGCVGYYYIYIKCIVQQAEPSPIVVIAPDTTADKVVVNVKDLEMEQIASKPSELCDTQLNEVKDIIGADSHHIELSGDLI